MDILRLIDRCERLGFELGVYCEWVLRPDGKRTHEIREHLYIRDPRDRRRRPPDDLAVAIMARARVVRGYLRRVRSPFFPERPTEADRRAALECSMADDRTLREHGR